ncbi:hypothetical protein [Paenibacillus sp. GM2]|nr:hypothetical protein [Paenibacillus sp. GM2]
MRTGRDNFAEWTPEFRMNPKGIKPFASITGRPIHVTDIKV